MDERRHAPGVGFDTCPECGTTVSLIALRCSRCGHPFVRNPAKMRKPGTRPVFWVLLVLFIGLMVGAYIFSPRARERMRNAAIAVGIPLTPWEDQAKPMADRLYDQKGAAIAENVLRITHPAGRGPQLAAYGVSAEGGLLVSRFEVSWQGASHSTNITSVEWRCSEGGHVSARVVRDDAMGQAVTKSTAQLNDYFATQLYPALAGKMN
jgi:hypothetical protein